VLSLIKIKDIHQCEDTDHIDAFVRTGPRSTHVVRAGDLAPAGTTLLTPDLEACLVDRVLFPTKLLSRLQRTSIPLLRSAFTFFQETFSHLQWCSKTIIKCVEC